MDTRARLAVHLGVPALVLAIGLLAGCNRPEVLNPQFVRDQMLGYSIGTELTRVVGMALQGHPLGPVDATGTCTQGTIHITGTLSQTDATDESDLSFDISDCLIGADYGFYTVTVTLNGNARLLGTWNRFLPEGQERTSADELHMEGIQNYQGNESAFDDRCHFDYTYVKNAVSEAILGDVCNRPYVASLTHTD
jgi:hypothetical protein